MMFVFFPFDFQVFDVMLYQDFQVFDVMLYQDIFLCGVMLYLDIQVCAVMFYLNILVFGVMLYPNMLAFGVMQSQLFVLYRLTELTASSKTSPLRVPAQTEQFLSFLLLSSPLLPSDVLQDAVQPVPVSPGVG